MQDFSIKEKSQSMEILQNNQEKLHGCRIFVKGKLPGEGAVGGGAKNTMGSTILPAVEKRKARENGLSLARIFHKGRRERSENAMDARNSAKRAADILKYFEEPFFRCDTAGMMFSGLAADRL